MGVSFTGAFNALFKASGLGSLKLTVQGLGLGFRI